MRPGAPMVEPLSNEAFYVSCPPCAPPRPGGGFACAICLDGRGGSFFRTLPCGHVFHGACADTWLRGHAGSCPVCRGSAWPRGHRTRGR